MKTIIAGSRGFTDYRVIERCVEIAKLDITEVVSGTAKGVDQLGEYWASEHDIPVKEFPAKWDEFGKAAGYKRNVQMAEYADALIAIWDGGSRGTKHMIDIAKKHDIKTVIFYPK